MKSEQQLLNELRTELGGNANTITKHKIIENAQNFTKSNTMELNTLLMLTRDLNAKFDKQISKINARRHNLTVKEYFSLLEKADKILRSFNTDFRTGDFKTLLLNGKLFHFIDERQHLGKGIKSGAVDLELNKRYLRDMQYKDGVWYSAIDNVNLIYIAELGHKQDYRLELRKGYFIEPWEIVKTKEPAPNRIR